MSNYNITLLERLLKIEKELKVKTNEVNLFHERLHNGELEWTKAPLKLAAMDQKDSNLLQLEMFDYGILRTMTLTDLDKADKLNTIRFLHKPEFLKKAMYLFGGAQCPNEIMETALLKRYDSWVTHYRNLDYSVEYAGS